MQFLPEADRVLVLAGGRVAACGAFRELSAAGLDLQLLAAAPPRAAAGGKPEQGEGGEEGEEEEEVGGGGSAQTPRLPA